MPDNKKKLSLDSLAGIFYRSVYDEHTKDNNDDSVSYRMTAEISDIRYLCVLMVDSILLRFAVSKTHIVLECSSINLYGLRNILI